MAQECLWRVWNNHESRGEKERETFVSPPLVTYLCVCICEGEKWRALPLRDPPRANEERNAIRTVVHRRHKSRLCATMTGGAEDTGLSISARPERQWRRSNRYTTKSSMADKSTCAYEVNNIRKPRAVSRATRTVTRAENESGSETTRGGATFRTKWPSLDCPLSRTGCTFVSSRSSSSCSPVHRLHACHVFFHKVTHTERQTDR